MIYKKYRLSRAVLCLMLVVFCGVLTQKPQPVFAKSESELTNQALITSLSVCYNDEHTKKTFATSGSQLSTIFTDAGKSPDIYLPFQADPISCQSVLLKIKREIFNNQTPTVDYTNYGYQVSSTLIESNGKPSSSCLSIQYQYFDTTWQTGKTGSYCFYVNDDGSVESAASSNPNSSGPYEMTALTTNDKLYMSFDDDKQHIFGLELDVFSVSQDKNTPGAWQLFVDKINEKLENYASKNSSTFSDPTTISGADPNHSSTTQTTTYTKLARSYAIREFLQFASGNPITIGDYSFTRQDKVDVLQSYIRKALQDSNGGSGLSMVTTSDSCWPDRSSVTAQYAFPLSGHGWCELRNVDSVPGDKYITFNSNIINGKKTFVDLMNQFMELSKSNDISVSDLDSSTLGDDKSDNQAPNNTNASCMKDATALGWILCPVLKFIGSTVGPLYKYIEEWLKVDPSFLATGNGTYSGWSQLRDIANILFIIVFILVILAQITGIGISNYGIKKILPKLIIVAVLVNISFLLCQLVVDLSNIVGASIYGLLHDLPTNNKVKPQSLSELVYGFLEYTGAGALSGAFTGVGAFAITATAITSPGSVLVPVLIGLLSVVISILFFFIILAVRQAGIIILVVLAPVAIICYALPNTKSFFDKWKRLFVALLMVYPICGALMGGGYFASNLILKNGDNNFLEAFVAMLLQIAPIFFIPTILRSSMAAMGNLGARISMLGNRFGRWSTGMLRNSDFVKRSSAELDNWGATKGQAMLGKANGFLRKIPGVKKIGNSKFGGVVKRLGDNGFTDRIRKGQTRRIARNVSAWKAIQSGEIADEYIARDPEGSLERTLEAQRFAQDQKLVDEAADSVARGSQSYEDGGVVHKINPNDAQVGGSLDNALNYYLTQYATTGDENTLIQARAIAKILAERGGNKGWATMANRMIQRNFDQATGVGTRDRAFDGLASYIANNGRWMSKLKDENPDFHAMVSDASIDSPLKTLMQYHAKSAGKISASMVPNLGDSFYDGQDYESARGTYDPNSDNYNPDAVAELRQLDKVLERAVTDPRIGPQIKPDDLRRINDTHRRLYDHDLEVWKQANPGAPLSDYEAQFGRYRNLDPERGIKIAHKDLPTGWHRVGREDLAKTDIITSGAKLGDWVQLDTAKKFKRFLDPAEVDKAQAIDRYNIDADLKNDS